MKLFAIPTRTKSQVTQDLLGCFPRREHCRGTARPYAPHQHGLPPLDHSNLVVLCLLVAISLLPQATLKAQDPLVPADCLIPCPPNQERDVLVDMYFDFDADTVLSRREVQCAFDCLDGDPYQEHTPNHMLISRLFIPPMIPGGTVSFLPFLRYHIDGPLKLPFASEGPIRIEGNGATILMHSRPCNGEDLPTRACLERLAPPGANAADVEFMLDHAKAWSIENLVFYVCTDADGACSNPLAQQNEMGAPFIKGIELHGMLAPTIRNCWFDHSFEVAVELHGVLNPHLVNLMFTNSKYHDILLSGGESCPYARAPGPTCWDTNPTDQPALISPPPGWAPWRSSLTSSGALIESTKTYGASYILPGEPEKQKQLRIDNSTGTTIQDAYLDGAYAPSALLVSSDTLPNNTYVRGWYNMGALSCPRDGSSIYNPLFYHATVELNNQDPFSPDSGPGAFLLLSRFDEDVHATPYKASCNGTDAPMPQLIYATGPAYITLHALPRALWRTVWDLPNGPTPGANLADGDWEQPWTAPPFRAAAGQQQHFNFIDCPYFNIDYKIGDADGDSVIGQNEWCYTDWCDQDGDQVKDDLCYTERSWPADPLHWGGSVPHSLTVSTYTAELLPTKHGSEPAPAPGEIFFECPSSDDCIFRAAVPGASPGDVQVLNLSLVEVTP